MSKAFKCDRCGRFVSLKKDDPDYNGPLSIHDGEPLIDLIHILRAHGGSQFRMDDGIYYQVCAKCKIEFDQWFETGREYKENEKVCKRYEPNNGDDLCVTDDMGASGCTCHGQVDNCTYYEKGENDE